MRNLGLLIALWLTALLPLNSLALGLGEIEVNSFLNQPLNAEIEVISARPGEVDDLLVSLASREAFNRAGLARPQHLSDLRFAVRKNEEGDQAVIVVTSRGAIKEPFLNFLIEADWSKGRLLREFTVLLDPPFFAEQPAPADTISETSMAQEDPAASPAPEPAADASAESTASSGTITEPIALSQTESPAQDTTISQTSSPPASSEYVADESKNIIEGDVLVVKGDTLWSIASIYKDDDHSMSQVMLAFQRSNPDAFANGNINNLRVGAVLRAPSAAELDAMDQQAAYAEVLLQNGLWDEYVARVSGGSVATGGSDTSTTGGDSGEESGGELSLLMPGEGDSESTGIGDGAEIEELRTKLALAEEELEATRIENKDLESRVSELQARLSKIEELQKMVEIEDDSLAQLQADQASDSAQSGSQDSLDSSVGEDAISETSKADDEALLEELLAEEAAAQAEEEAAIQAQGEDEAAQMQDEMLADAGADGVAEDDMMEDEAMEEVAAAEQAASDQMMDEEAQAPSVTPPPAPVIVTEPATASSSIFDGLLPPSVIAMIAPIAGLFANPIILAAIGGVIVLLLVLVVVKRRKAAQGDDADLAASADDDLFASDDEDDFTPIHMADEHLDTDIKVPSTDDMDSLQMEAGAAEEEVEQPADDFASTSIIQATDMPEPEGAAPAAAVAEQDDVLNEVDVYLAYGLYDNAEELLVSSLGENPGRADYRSKLLDTYFATKNAEAFVGEAEKLKDMGDAAASYWDRVQIMGYELAPDNALFSDAKDSGLSAADLEIAKPQEADFDLGGGDEDDTNFSADDFNLGEEDLGTDISFDETSGEAGDLGETQQVSEGDDLLDLPDDLGEELEFSMDEQGTGDELQISDDLELSDDLDLGEDQLAVADDEETELENLGESEEEDFGFDIDDDDLDIDDAVELSPPQEEVPGFEKTSIVTPNYEETAVIEDLEVAADSEDSSEIDLGMDDTAVVDSIESLDGADDDIDLGMDDTAMRVDDDIVEATGELELDTGDDDDSEDISIIDFGGDDFVEPTAIMPTIEESADDDFEIDDEESEEIRTGTFAPGDFDEPTEAVASIADVDDIDDLMLPDDVDEVSTKLDLARAFIDMGDTEGARGSLEEVISEGNADQKAEAKALLDQM